LCPEIFYSPSPEYPVACYRDEWRGEPRRSSLERRRVGFGAIPLRDLRMLIWQGSWKLMQLKKNSMKNKSDDMAEENFLA